VIFETAGEVALIGNADRGAIWTIDNSAWQINHCARSILDLSKCCTRETPTSF
jgi:hypothetical protein